MATETYAHHLFAILCILIAVFGAWNSIFICVLLKFAGSFPFLVHEILLVVTLNMEVLLIIPADWRSGFSWEILPWVPLHHLRNKKKILLLNASCWRMQSFLLWVLVYLLLLVCMVETVVLSLVSGVIWKPASHCIWKMKDLVIVSAPSFRRDIELANQGDFLR